MTEIQRQLERVTEILDTDIEHAVAWLSDPEFAEIVDLNDLDPIARDDLMFAYGYLRAVADGKGQTHSRAM